MHPDAQFYFLENWICPSHPCVVFFLFHAWACQRTQTPVSFVFRPRSLSVATVIATLSHSYWLTLRRARSLRRFGPLGLHWSHSILSFWLRGWTACLEAPLAGWETSWATVIKAQILCSLMGLCKMQLARCQNQNLPSLLGFYRK